MSTSTAQLIIADQYMIVLAISLLFTILSLASFWRVGNKVSVTKSVSLVITVVLWFVCGSVHIAASPTDSPLFSIAYMWWALGVVFLILLVYDSFQAIVTMQDKKWGSGY